MALKDTWVDRVEREFIYPNDVNQIAHAVINLEENGGGGGGGTGADGKSAYEIAVENGFEGTEEEWLESLKGDTGPNGYTPQKGVDYWNAEDKEEIEADISAEVAEQLADKAQLQPEYADSLEVLEEKGDTSKLYVLPDGYIYAYMTIETAGSIEEVTDQITGEFTEGFRLSTSSGSLSTLAGAISTPFIDISGYGEVFTVHLDGSSAVKWGATTNTTGNSYCLYKADGTFIKGGYTGSTPYNGITYVVNSANDVDITFDTSILENGFEKLRFSASSGTADTVSVSVTYEKEVAGGIEAKWKNTGHAFVPADYEDRIVALEAENTALKTKVKALEDAAFSGGNVPDYVLTEAEEIADKVLAVRNADSFVMALASDLHTDGEDASSVSVLHAGQGMDTINTMTQLDLVALLGDYEIYYFNHGEDNTGSDNEDARKSFKHTKKAFSSVEKGAPFMMLQGNHDQFVNDTTEEAQQKYYAYIGANNVGTVTDYDNKFRNYGYRDFENYKIRVIYLNTADVSDSAVTSDYNVSSEQLTWLNTVALNLTDIEWGIIVLSHHPLNWYGMGNLLNALDEYKGKGEGAELIAHFHGHLHNFRAETLGSNSIPTITIPNACFGRNNEYGTSSSYSDEIKATYGDADENGNQRVFAKTADTAEDTAFNVVAIDRQNRKIHCFNYGAGIDRVITY